MGRLENQKHHFAKYFDFFILIYVSNYVLKNYN